MRSAQRGGAQVPQHRPRRTRNTRASQVPQHRPERTPNRRAITIADALVPVAVLHMGPGCRAGA
eukprot:9910273-Alexandrium_andersonii.AAC.1